MNYSYASKSQKENLKKEEFQLSVEGIPEIIKVSEIENLIGEKLECEKSYEAWLTNNRNEYII